jgi:hypothetical protein
LRFAANWMPVPSSFSWFTAQCSCISSLSAIKHVISHFCAVSICSSFR